MADTVYIYFQLLAKSLHHPLHPFKEFQAIDFVTLRIRGLSRLTIEIHETLLRLQNNRISINHHKHTQASLPVKTALTAHQHP